VSRRCVTGIWYKGKGESSRKDGSEGWLLVENVGDDKLNQGKVLPSQRCNVVR
jgi:hypothetical protein